MLPGRKYVCALEVGGMATLNIQVHGPGRFFSVNNASNNDTVSSCSSPCTEVTGRFGSPGVVSRRGGASGPSAGHNCLQDTLDWNKIDCPDFLQLAKEVLVEDLFDCIISDKMYSKTGERAWDLSEFVLQRKDRRMFIGGQGVVLFVRRQGHSTSLAMKVCYHRREEKKVERHVQRTILHLKAQGVSQFVGKILVNYLTRRFFVTIMPKAKFASLKSLKQTLGPLPESTVRYYFASILSALVKLHAIQICHRDVKCDNVLVMHNGRPALIDFGLAVRGAPSLDEFKSNPRVTQMQYYPPETKMVGNAVNDYKIDAWLLGFFLCEMLFSDRDHLWSKFKGSSHKDWMFAFCANCPSCPRNPTVTAVLSRLLVSDPRERVHVVDVHHMPYMADGGYYGDIEVMEPPLARLQSTELSERDTSEN